MHRISSPQALSSSITQLFSTISISLFLSENNTKISDVCTKYQEACRIVNLALTGIISQCVPGAKIFDLCQFGTSLINTEASKLYTKKINGNLLERGVAFPVCISVNENVCNISPLASDEMVSVENAALLCFCYPFKKVRIPESVTPSWLRSLVLLLSLL